jgi:3'-phosphoadenosine 5'-phosphosulfate sulfotransferase (PAPS reductase)/FAD synthetase
MKYTREQIATMRSRLQEYVDIGWNKAPRQLNLCPLCKSMTGTRNIGCFPCPLALKDGSPGCTGDMTERRWNILLCDEPFSRKEARAHARWLVRCYNAADESGEWSIG